MGIENNNNNTEQEPSFLVSSWPEIVTKIEGDFGIERKKKAVQILSGELLKKDIFPTNITKISQSGSLLNLNYKENGKINNISINILTLHVFHDTLRNIRRNFITEATKLRVNIAAMKYLVALNNQETNPYDKDYYLNEGDKMTDGYYEKDFNHGDYSNQIKGKTLKEIQIQTRSFLKDMLKQYEGTELSGKEFRDDLNKAREDYYIMSMGIGPKNKLGSNHFYKTDRELQTMTIQIVENKNIDECFQFLDKIIDLTYANKKKNRGNEKIEPLVLQSLGEQIFNKLVAKENNGKLTPQKRNELTRYYLKLAKKITGRDKSLNSMNKNPILASKILLQAMNISGGLIDQLEETGKFKYEIKDPVVGKRSPKQVLDDTIEALGGKNSEGEKLFYDQIITSGQVTFDENTTYDELPLEQKEIVSMIARVGKKACRITAMVREIKDPEALGKHMSKLFQEIGEESQKAIQDGINNNFEKGGKYKNGVDDSNIEEFGIDLNEANKQVLDIYNDIEGNTGMFDFSDINEEIGKTLLTKALPMIMGAVVIFAAAGAIATLAIPAGAATAVVVGTVLLGTIGVTALDRLVINPRSHSSAKEATVDLGTDIIINAMQAIVFAKFIIPSRYGYGLKGLFLTADVVSGIGVEYWRDAYLIEELYGGTPLNSEDTPEEDDDPLEDYDIIATI